MEDVSCFCGFSPKKRSQLLLLVTPLTPVDTTLSGLKDWRPEFGTVTGESRRGNPKKGESERKIPKFHV